MVKRGRLFLPTLQKSQNGKGSTYGGEPFFNSYLQNWDIKLIVVYDVKTAGVELFSARDIK